MQRAPAYKQITQPVDLTGRIKPGFLQNSEDSQIESAKDFRFDTSTWREKKGYSAVNNKTSYHQLQLNKNLPGFHCKYSF